MDTVQNIFIEKVVNFSRNIKIGKDTSKDLKKVTVASRLCKDFCNFGWYRCYDTIVVVAV
jgi:dihydrodipicolinate synthase/N-acetylneuraminate lyase